MKRIYIQLILSVFSLSLLSCVEDIKGTTWGAVTYSKTVPHHSELRQFGFVRVEPSGMVIMMEQRKKVYYLHARAGQLFRYENGDKIDFRLKSASFRQQEAIVEYGVKFSGPFQ
jgi:hypothetical protein